jgi:ribosome-binding ATPase YchF (GTP1/OBG family)
LGGASMAAHPFTTIDPNIGYCLIPAPFGMLYFSSNRFLFSCIYSSS